MESENNNKLINNVNLEPDYTSIIVTILIGIISGFILGYYLFKPKTFHGPDSNDVKKEIYEDSNGKYQWDTIVTICPLGTVPHK